MRERLYGGASRVADGLVNYRGMIWSQVRVRKTFTCFLTNAAIMKGDFAYRPMTNSGDRMLRVATPTWDRPAEDVLKEVRQTSPLGYVETLRQSDPDAPARIAAEGAAARAAGANCDTDNPYHRDGEYGWWRNGFFKQPEPALDLL